MKKSELKQKILRLEHKNKEIEQYLTMQEEITDTIILSLRNEHDVKINVNLPEPPKINAATLNDTEEKFINGMTTEFPTITFDFTKHDLKVIKNITEESE